jgi:hypothetical protein
MELPLETERLAFSDLTGDDDLDHGALMTVMFPCRMLWMSVTKLRSVSKVSQFLLLQLIRQGYKSMTRPCLLLKVSPMVFLPITY